MILFDFAVPVIYVPRLVTDSWLELKFPSAEVGESVVAVVQTLRATWTELLETKLTASHSNTAHI